MTPDFSAVLLTKVKGEIESLYPTAPIKFSNTPVPDTELIYFVVHVMMSDDVFPTCIGSKSGSRSIGILQVDVFTPKDRGAGEGHRASYAIGKKMKRFTSTVTTEGILVLKDPSVQDRGEVNGKQKHQVNIPLRYDFNDT